MRRIIGLLLILLLALAAIADRVSVVELFLRLPSWLKFGLGWLTPWENWLIDNEIHPLPLALAIVVLFALVITPGDLRRLLPQRRRTPAREEFAIAYNTEPQQNARHEFRWGIERSYRRYAEAEKIAWDKDRLVRLIDDFRLPSDFPPAGPVDARRDATPTWPSPEDQELWRFACRVFADALHPSESELLGSDYRIFLHAERQTAQFWDDWGRAIGESRDMERAAQPQVAANARDIKMLALAELALAEILPWSEGDRSGLYLLAANVATSKTNSRATASETV